MRYRKLDPANDYVFGRGAGNFIANTPETVGQAVETRLGLALGEWFLDTTVGTPYNSRILGTNKLRTYDAAIQEVILGTPGVTSLAAYTSSVNPSTRAATVSATINTIYGQTTITTSL